MHSRYLARSDERSNEVSMALFPGEIDGRRRPFLAAQDLAQIDRLAEMAAMATNQQNDFALGLEAQGGHFPQIRQEADTANGRRWQDRLPVGLVVERDIARNDREVEHPAGFANALDGLDECAHDLGPLRVAKVEVVSDGDRIGADGREVTPAFGDRLLSALERVGLDIARRDVGRNGETLGTSFDANDAGITAGDLRRVRLDQVVIL